MRKDKAYSRMIKSSFAQIVGFRLKIFVNIVLVKEAGSDNEMFNSELGVDVERGAHIMSNIGRLQTTYQKAYEYPGQSIHSSFD